MFLIVNEIQKRKYKTRKILKQSWMVSISLRKLEYYTIAIGSSN